MTKSTTKKTAKKAAKKTTTSNETPEVPADTPPAEGGSDFSAPEVEVNSDDAESDDYPVAHMIDKEVDPWRALCGETIKQGELPDRTLAYTCSECQNIVTEQKNAVADALLASQLKLRVIQTVIVGARFTEPLDTNWTRRVREVAADATDALLEQRESGPSNDR